MHGSQQFHRELGNAVTTFPAPGVRLEVTARCWNDENGPYILLCRRTDVPAGSPPTIYCLELLQTWGVNGAGDPIPVSGRWLHDMNEEGISTEIALGNPMHCRQPKCTPARAPDRADPGATGGAPSSTRPSDFCSEGRSSAAPSPQAQCADALTQTGQMEAKAPPQGFDHEGRRILPQPQLMAGPTPSPSASRPPAASPCASPSTPAPTSGTPAEEYPGHSDYLASRDDKFFRKNREAEQKAAAEAAAAKEAAARLAEADAAAAQEAAELLEAGPPQAPPPALPDIVKDDELEVEDVTPPKARGGMRASMLPVTTPKPHAWPAAGVFLPGAAPSPPAAPGLASPSGLPVKAFPGQKKMKPKIPVTPPLRTMAPISEGSESGSQAPSSPRALSTSEPQEDAPSTSSACEESEQSLETETETMKADAMARAKAKAPAPLCDGGGVGTVQFCPGTADLWPGPPDPHANPPSQLETFDIASEGSDEEEGSLSQDVRSSEVSHELLSQPKEEVQSAARAAGVESGEHVQQMAPTIPPSQPIFLDLGTALDDTPQPLHDKLIQQFILALTSAPPPSRDIRENVAHHLYVRGQEIPPALAELIRQGRGPRLALQDRRTPSSTTATPASSSTSQLPTPSPSQTMTTPASASGRPLWTQGEWINGTWQWSPAAWEAWKEWEDSSN